MPNLTYLASPYFHPDRVVRMARYEAAVDASARMFSAGEFVFSPIVLCAEAAERHGLPTDFDFWQAFDTRMIGACDSLAVLMIPGWDVSKGIAAEVAIARTMGLPVRYVNPAAYEVRV